jgi:hypothetical protein
MRTSRQSWSPAYVIVSSGIGNDIESPTLLDDVQAWVEWRKAFEAYALIPIPGEGVADDEILLPAAIWQRTSSFPFYWRLRSFLLNLARRSLVRELAKREAVYFSQQVIEARRKAAQ